MRKLLIFLLVATLLVAAAAAWAVGSLPVVIGGKEIVALRPEALLFLLVAVVLFAVALVVAIAAAVSTWMHRAAPAETPAPPEETAPAAG